MGLFAAIAIIFGYVESLIPFFAGIPGIKLGLANLSVLFILETYTWKEAALVSVGPDPGDRLYVREHVQYPLQYGRCCFEPYSDDPYETLFRIQHPGRQRRRWCVPQHRTIDHSRPYCRKYPAFFYHAPVLLISGVITGILIGILCREVVTKRIHL